MSIDLTGSPKTETGIPDEVLKEAMDHLPPYLTDPHAWNYPNYHQVEGAGRTATVTTSTGTNGPFTQGSTLSANELNQAFSSVLYAPPNFISRISAPNFFQRLLWRALGVTWKDLRPERDMEALRRLK